MKTRHYDNLLPQHSVDFLKRIQPWTELDSTIIGVVKGISVTVYRRAEVIAKRQKENPSTENQEHLTDLVLILDELSALEETLVGSRALPSRSSLGGGV